jgi:hypothetical protein
LETLISKLILNPSRQVVEKRNIDTLLGSQNLANKLITDTQAAAFGTQVGAGAVAVVSVKKMALNYQLSCQLIHVQTQRILKSVRFNLQEDTTLTALLNTADPAPAKSAAAPAASQAAAPAPAAVSGQPSQAAGASKPSAPAGTGTFSKNLNDIKTEQAQTAAFNEFTVWVDKNFPNITLEKPVIKKNYNDTYEVSFTWRHTDKIDVVQTMAGFYRLLSDASKDPQYVEALKVAAKSNVTYSGAFDYYQTTYANEDLRLSYFVFPANRQNVLAFLNSSPLSWNLEFTLFDTVGNVIDVWNSPRLNRSAPFGKGTASGSHTFTINADAYNALGEVKLTKITMRK